MLAGMTARWPRARRTLLSRRLCRDYWPPLYSFVRRRGYAPADAQDLVQGFFAYFLRSKAYMHAERAKGKFRSFLLASLKHYMANVWDREHALKRGGDYEFVLLDTEVEVVEASQKKRTVTASDEEQAYEQRWAHARWLCACTLDEEFPDGAKARLFSELKPFFAVEQVCRARRRLLRDSRCRSERCAAIFYDSVYVTPSCCARKWPAPLGPPTTWTRSCVIFARFSVGS